MIQAHLNEARGMLVVKPDGPLTQDDFERVARLVDEHLGEHDELKGLLIDAAAGFPGWNDFAGLVSHLRFVREHHRDIKKVAAVADDAFLTVMPAIATHFVAAEVRHFYRDERDAAVLWITG